MFTTIFYKYKKSIVIIQHVLSAHSAHLSIAPPWGGGKVRAHRLLLCKAALIVFCFSNLKKHI